MKNTHMVGVRLPDPLWKWLSGQSQEKGVSIQFIMVQALLSLRVNEIRPKAGKLPAIRTEA
jgi:hypothetical protein